MFSLWNQWICPGESTEHFRFELQHHGNELKPFELKIPKFFPPPLNCWRNLEVFYVAAFATNELSRKIKIIIFLSRVPWTFAVLTERTQIWNHFYNYNHFSARQKETETPEVKMGQNIYPRKRRVLLLHSCEVLYLELIYISELHSSLQLRTSQLRGRGWSVKDKSM